MHIPNYHAEQRLEVLHQLMKTHPLGTLVTLEAGGLNANHLPIELIAPTPEAPFGTLRAHISRANNMWKNLDESVDALVSFQGPSAYITANWYDEKHLSGAEVPTYNYAVVHAHGSLRLIHDAQWLLTHLRGLSEIHEASQPLPWKISDAPADFIDKLVKGLVGIEIPVKRLEGKWKVSQNRTTRDQANVVAGLRATGTPEAVAMAALVERAGQN
jgi:transcriptional regulator